MTIAARVLIVAAVAGLIAVAATERAPQELLTQVYTPSFRRVPPAPPIAVITTRLWRDLETPAGQAFLQRLLPDQGGVLWLSLALTLLIAFDFERLDNPRNVDLLILQALGLLFFEILRFFSVLQDPAYVAVMDWVFSGVFLLNMWLVVRAVRRLGRPDRIPWRPVHGRRALMAIALALVVCDTMAALVREPDDVGFFVNLGAQRLRERRALPYGDPLLTGSPGAAYGPLLYVAHLPFQLALSPEPVNTDSPDRPPLGDAATYKLPPPLATKLCTIAFHLLGLAALFIAGRRLRSATVGWALVALYAGSVFVLGIGGGTSFIGGMTYISHIAPTAMTLVAFACLPAPVWAGVALAVAAGVGFYPAFMAPAWLGYYWTDRRSRWAFAAGFCVTALAIGVPVLLMSRPAGDRGLIGTILWDTFGHHTDPRHYGFSPFSFWGQKEGIRGWLSHPLVGGSGFSTPIFVAFLALAAGSFRLTRRAAAHQLALVTAVIAIAASLLKIHPTGTYVAWAYPFLLIGWFADPIDDSAEVPAGLERASEADVNTAEGSRC